MLERLELENVGPAPSMVLDLAPRLNIVTGDNGLGKSFLLDIAWWALTRRWPRDLNPRLTSGYVARPTDVGRPAKLRFTLTTSTGLSRSYESEYSALDEGWPGKPGRPWNPGLVIHAHADGGFSVWDPASPHFSPGQRSPPSARSSTSRSKLVKPKSFLTPTSGLVRNAG